MPELPEVETIRRGLHQHVTGRVVSTVEVLHPRCVRRGGGSADFVHAVVGRRVDDVRRRGKYLWFPLDSGDAVVAHLGMSGQLLVKPPSAPREPHLRGLLTFVDGRSDLRFVDQRTFGSLALSPGPVTPGGLPPLIAHIAPDPLDALYGPDTPGGVERFRDAIRRRRTGLKRALLDQTVVSGVGNIYADEALWRAALNPGRATATLRRAEAERLLVAVRGVLADAIEAGGTSFDALYVDVDGRGGYFERRLAVYGRVGRPCPRCGESVVRQPFMNRSSFTCPRCQPGRVGVRRAAGGRPRAAGCA